MTYKIKNKTTGKYFCGWHEYVQTDSMGNERWNDVFPYWEGKGYPVETYETMEDLKDALENLKYLGDELDFVSC